METINFKVSPDINTNGTHYQGNLNNLKYSTIVEILGDPSYTGEMGIDKVQAEWCLQSEVNGKLVTATLYDWKNYETPIEEITTWHIGGYSFDAVLLVMEILNSKK